MTRALSEMRLALYPRQDIGITVLVEADQLITEMTRQGQSPHTVSPMRMHGNVQAKIMELYRSLSGHSHENKLRTAFSRLDFTPYEVQTRGEAIVVFTKDYMQALQGG